MRFVPLELFSSLVEVYGFVWVFWGLCLSLFATDLTLRTRKAIGRGDPENNVKRQHVVELLESSQQDHSLPTSTLDPTTFPLEKISIMAVSEAYSHIYNHKVSFLGELCPDHCRNYLSFSTGVLIGSLTVLFGNNWSFF